MKIDTFCKIDQRVHVKGKILMALEELENELGIKFNFAGGKYSENEYTMKLKASMVNDNGEIYDKKANMFIHYATRLGFVPEDLGRVFRAPGSFEEFKITGYKPRNYKYPICAVSVSNNKRYKFSVSAVKNGLL